MIRIFKDRDNKVVTKGAYETFYKPLGYQIVIEEKNVASEKPVTSHKVVDDDLEVSKEDKATGVSSRRNIKKGYQNDIQD